MIVYKERFASSIATLILVLLGVMILPGLRPTSASAFGQEVSQTPTEEIVANLASGRIMIVVAKDAILIGTIENPIEAETRPPVPVQLGEERVGILLGPVNWVSPSSHQDFAKLDQELPHLHSSLVNQAPHLEGSQGGGEATDIEATGQGLMERLSSIAKLLHGKLNVPSNEPFTELIVADYLGGYGPEVWQLTYTLKQEQEHGDYWDTRISRPNFLQFWPPEKGHPHTLVEFAYPPEGGPPSLLTLLKQKDPRIENIRGSDAAMARVADHLLQGESNQIAAADAAQFLRAALAAIASPNERETMAIIGERSGFQWILAPPPEPVKPEQQNERPADAPSLLKSSSSP